MAAPLAAPLGFTAVTGAATHITVTQVQATQAPATGMFWRVVDTVTGSVISPGGNAATTNALVLVTGRTYSVSAAWFGGAGQMSDWSPPALVVAG